MIDVFGRDQETEVIYHITVARIVTVVAANKEQAVERAVDRVGHLMVEEGVEFPGYCGYEVTGAEDLTPELADAPTAS